MGSKWKKRAQGVISIFLSIILLPFFSIAALLIETSRYSAAVEELETIMSSSALSTLANYDEYLLDRFGLLATTQDQSMESHFDYYLTQNLTSPLFSNVGSKSIKGTYPLSDLDVLYRQCLESSKLSAPTKFLMEAVDLEELIKALEDLLDIGGILTALSGAGDAVGGYADLAEHTEKLQAVAEKLETKVEEYKKNYKAWVDAVHALANELALWDSEDYFWDPDYYFTIETAEETARNKYVDSIDDIKALLKEAVPLLEKIAEDRAGITSAFGDITKGVVETAIDDEVDDRQTPTAEGSDYSYNAISEVNKESNKAVGDFADRVAAICSDGVKEDMDEMLGKLDTQKSNVEAYIVTSGSKLSYSYNDTYYQEIPFVSAEELKDLLSKQEELFTENKGLWETLNTIFDVFRSMSEIELLFNVDCCAIISGDLDAGENLTYMMMQYFMSGMASAGSAVGNFVTLHWIKALREIKNAFDSFKNFITTLGRYVNEVVTNLTTLSGEHLLFNLYLMYNLPNRTDFSDGKTLNGFSYSDRSFPDSLNPVYMSGALDALESIYNGFAGAGTDPVFVGAEFEYILQGQSSEYLNQTLCFLDIYFLRLLIDAFQVVSNQEVKMMATLASSVGLGWLVYLLEIFCEPLVDTVMLVNGEKISVWKKDVFLTPSGAEKMLTKLCNFKIYSESKKQEQLKNFSKVTSIPTFSSAYQNTPESNKFGYSLEDLLEISYSEHLFLILFLTGNVEKSKKRLSNLIIMETQTKYDDEGYGVEFKLDNAYTMLSATAQVQVSQLLPIPALSSYSLFSVERTIYRGY